MKYGVFHCLIDSGFLQIDVAVHSIAALFLLLTSFSLFPWSFQIPFYFKKTPRFFCWLFSLPQSHQSSILTNFLAICEYILVPILVNVSLLRYSASSFWAEICMSCSSLCCSLICLIPREDPGTKQLLTKNLRLN
jgi:hypothetical protein